MRSLLVTTLMAAFLLLAGCLRVAGVRTAPVEHGPTARALKQSESGARKNPGITRSSDKPMGEVVVNESLVHTRGRFVNPTREQALIIRVTKNGYFEVFSDYSKDGPPPPGKGIPAYSIPLPEGSRAELLALASGDLDRLADRDGSFHDEAVIVFEGKDRSVEVQVLDYMHEPGKVTVTVTNLDALGKLTKHPWGWMGSLAVGVGDSDGDPRNEIAVGWQTDTEWELAILRYRNDGTRRMLWIVGDRGRS